MLAKAGADIVTILDRTEEEARDILQMAHLFALDELTEYARIFAQNDLMQKNQGTPQLGLELAFLQSLDLHRRAQSGQTIMASSVTVEPQPVSTSSRPTVLPTVQRPPITQEMHHAQPETSIASSRNGKEPIDASAEPDYLYSFREEDEEIAVPVVPAAQPSASVKKNAPRDNEDVVTSSEQGTDVPALTLEQVQDTWENVKKRIKQKNNQTAAMLNYYTVVGIDESVEPFLVVIRAKNKVFYEHMQQGDRVKYVEWGLGMEFGRKFRVQLLLPEQAVPPPPVSRAANIAPSAAPQQSAHREHPASIQQATNAQPEAKVTGNGANGHVNVTDPLAEVNQPLSIVKKNILRENTTTVTESLPFETIKQKASADPVVQEVIRTFTAKIVDIRPK